MISAHLALEFIFPYMNLTAECILNQPGNQIKEDKRNCCSCNQHEGNYEP